jgi:glycosyltransferase involved in cell wall biosynthesis
MSGAAVAASGPVAESPVGGGRRPLRVLIALPGLHRVSRGAEVALEAIGDSMGARPDVEVVLAGSGPPRPGRQYRYVPVPCRPRERFESWPRIPPFRGAVVYEDWSFARALKRRIDTANFDVTLTCAYPFTSWVLRGGLTRPSSGPAHAFVTQNGDWAPQRRNAEYRFFRCDGLVCTNPEYLRRHQQRYRCALIPNGVDTSRFSPGAAARESLGIPACGPVVLIVSALIESKRVVEGIEAAARLKGACVVVAGDGPLRDAAEEAGRRFLGARFLRLSVPHDRMPSVYRSADVLLHMSRDEPFGNIYLEAMSTGLPVVAHDSINSRWILGEHGILVDTGDPAAVAHGLERALADRSPEAARARRQAVADRFEWSVVGEQYAAFLAEVAAGRVPP